MELPGARALGQARLTWFGFHVYDARLWAAASLRRDNYPLEPFVLELTYLRDFRGEAIAERTLKEMRQVEPFHEAQGQAWLAQMKQLFPDVTKGDRLAGVHHPAGRIEFFRNDRPIGEIRDAAFARIFGGVWLSPRTSVPGVREALFGEVR